MQALFQTDIDLSGLLRRGTRRHRAATFLEPLYLKKLSAWKSVYTDRMETIQIIEEEPAIIIGCFPMSRADFELITEGLLLLEKECQLSATFCAISRRWKLSAEKAAKSQGCMDLLGRLKEWSRADCRLLGFRRPQRRRIPLRVVNARVSCRNRKPKNARGMAAAAQGE
jgi:hypothetical protein